ncbi:unnamed protein product [Closterium sp. Naga37s-1]|nr:unnamed protein product [Closterium sp. Naga37s-1]
MRLWTTLILRASSPVTTLPSTVPRQISLWRFSFPAEFDELQKAYEVLSDEQARKAYDDLRVVRRKRERKLGQQSSKQHTPATPFSRFHSPLTPFHSLSLNFTAFDNPHPPPPSRPHCPAFPLPRAPPCSGGV